MNPDAQREAALFQAAAELTGAARATFLDGACHGNPALRQRLEALLAANDQTAGVLADGPSPFRVPPSGGPAAQPSKAGTPNSPAAKATMKLELTDAPDETVGQKIGRYKILERVGEGGCGVVYVAEQTEPVRRRVALKVIKLGMDTKQVVARFEAERQALAMMDHPNIAKVLDAGATETGRPYFVMELVRGIKITDYCDQAQLPTNDRLDLFIQVCHAIQHAHQKGIIHRDIKPSNILVTLNDGVAVPKVIDFGIAKATEGRLTDATVYTQLHQFIGTPAYMSPEQAEMSSLDIDTRSDIYSLGVLLYELLAGSTPFDGKELMSLGIDAMRKIIREREPARPSTRLATLQGEQLSTTAKRHAVEVPKLMRQLKGDLDWIVMKCLEKDRSRRYDTANGLAMDIKRHLTCEPVVARPPSKFYEFQRTIRRHKVGFAATAAIIIVLAGGVVVSAWQAVRATRATHDARTAREQAETNEHKAVTAQASEAKLRVQAEANEKKAETEAARSVQVAQFMKDMLKGVGPSVALGRDTTLLREILDQTVQRLDALKGQPEVEADLRETIGVLYRDLSDYPKAEAMLQKSLALRRQLYGNENASVASALNHLADVLRLEHRDAEAEAAFREALAIRRKLFGEESLEVAESFYGLAEVLRRTSGTINEAETDHRKALAIRRKLLGNGSLAVANSLIGLGVSFEPRANAAERKDSIACFREALQIQRQLLGNEHPDIAYTLHNLGSVICLEADGQQEGEAMVREAVAMDKKILGDSRETAFAITRLAQVVTNPSEAVTLRREALAIRRKVLGEDHSETVGAKVALAWELAAEGKSDEAEALYRDALIFEGKRDSESVTKFYYEYRLGNFLVRRQRYAEAEPLLLSAYQGLRQNKDKIPPWQKWLEPSARQRLLSVYQATGARDKALSLLREIAEPGDPQALDSLAWDLATSPSPEGRDGSNAVAYAERAVALTSRTNAQILATLGAAYAQAGRFAQAIGTQQRAIALSTSESEKLDNTRRLKPYEAGLPYRDHGALAEQAMALLQIGKFSEAESSARECLALRERLIPDDWPTFNARSLLGGSLLGQKKYAEAEPLLLSGYEGLMQRKDKLPAKAQVRPNEALQRLVQLYEETNRPEQAARLKKELESANPSAAK